MSAVWLRIASFFYDMVKVAWGIACYSVRTQLVMAAYCLHKLGVYIQSPGLNFFIHEQHTHERKNSVSTYFEVAVV